MKKLFTQKLLAVFVIFLSIGVLSQISAQKAIISGTISDTEGSLIGASVVVRGTSTGTTTDLDGNYSLSLDPGSYVLTVSYVGYGAINEDVTVTAGQNLTKDFLMQPGALVEEIVVLGTRAGNRTNTNSSVPVDVINVSKLAVSAPQTSVNELLHYSAPSFSSNTQTISDGTDHIDPASLRGLGPDQVLVLMNGKRRHNTSLVNVNGTFGRGNVGTDLNAFPTAAISNIQVLRDGAAAQYGSDAIAGVIDIRLKKTVNELKFNVFTGANFTSDYRIGPFEGEDKSVDGEKVVIGVNYGLPLGDNGGYINMTGEFDYRGSTNRMREFEGGIFNQYNTVERLAGQAGLDISALTEAQVNQYSQQAGFTNGDLSLADLQSALSADNTSSELAARGQQRTDYNMRVGQSEGRGGKLFYNMGIPLGENLEIYSFGGTSYRNGTSGCFYRLPSQSRTTTAIYPNGTVPKINSNIRDQSMAAGIRGEVSDWNIDFSLVHGSNDFQYRMTDTHNATLGPSSPTDFNVGGHTFTQSTGNLDLAQYIDNVGSLLGINVAFGAEFRTENFKINQGSEQSYGNYDINGNLVNPVTPNELLTRDFFGANRPSGSQCFAGFLPVNEIDANRSSIAGYGDVEFDFTENFIVGAALRFEEYSDFGSTFNYKLSSRLTVSDGLNLRGAIASGFRAPSLHQINFNKTSTIFEVNAQGVSVANERGTFSNTSRAAQLLGIPQLKEESSNNYSLGFTSKIADSNLSVTVDGYIVKIEDRVVLTGAFSAGSDEELQRIFAQAGAGSAVFFANAINTTSKGLDIVLSHKTLLSSGGVLKNDLAGTFSKTTADRGSDGNIIINASELLERKGLVGNYFDETSRIYLEEAVPRTKFTLSNTYEKGKLNIYLRNTYFGKTKEATNNVDNQQIYDGKVITDLSFGYNVSENLSFTIGSNNILDVYPDETLAGNRSSGRFVYSRRSPQFSTGGRHLFARLSFTLN